MYIKDNEATASLRRVPLYIYADTAGAAWAGSVMGVKAKLSLNGAAEVDSTNDVVRVAGVLHYVELTQAEANRAPGDLLHVRMPSASGRLEAFNVVEIGADDFTVAAPTDSSITTAVWAAGARTLTSGAAPDAATVAAAVWANGTRTLSSYGTLVTDVVSGVWAAGTRELTGISASIREAFADTLLGRALQGGANGGRTVRDALRALRNRVFRSGATLTVTQEDDSTVAFTAALTTDTNAVPITGVDPS